mmetsp:Transcript_12478/g.37635  ORF Transcript_12478/g.37635 Transcript_12478/m.37635 type:complete len:400 (-) Transcript_12478:157-1356(-)
MMQQQAPLSASEESDIIAAAAKDSAHPTAEVSGGAAVLLSSRRRDDVAASSSKAPWATRRVAMSRSLRRLAASRAVPHSDLRCTSAPRTKSSLTTERAPFCAAKYKALKPTPGSAAARKGVRAWSVTLRRAVEWSTSAPASSRATTTWCRRANAATPRGERPYLFALLASAPCATRYRTRSRWPRCAASHRGVWPKSFDASRPTSSGSYELRRYSKASRRPWSTATYAGEQLRSRGINAAAGCAKSTRRASVEPPAIADATGLLEGSAFVEGFAPCSSKNLTTATLRAWHATASAVRPSWSAGSTLAPAAASCRIAASDPSFGVLAATQSAVRPRRVAASTSSAPFSKRARMPRQLRAAATIRAFSRSASRPCDAHGVKGNPNASASTKPDPQTYRNTS